MLSSSTLILANGMTNNRSEIRSIFVFIFLLVLFATCGYVVLLNTKDQGSSVGVLIVQFSPMVAAFMSSLIHHRSLHGFGWSVGPSRYYGVALVLPFLLALISFVLIWTSGLGVPNIAPLASEGRDVVADFIGIRLNSDAMAIAVLILLNGTLGLAFAFGAIGEELGWRGFLAPKLMQLYGFTTSAVIVGSLWAFFHFPLVIWVVAPALGVLVWPLLLSSLLVCIGITLIMNWLRFKSGSVWVAVIFHMSLNSHVQGVFQPMTVITCKDSYYLAGEYGFVLAVVCLVVGIGFWHRRATLS